MSLRALNWAAGTLAGGAANKAVLYALANQANDHSGLSFPSVAYICQHTELNRKTVIDALDRLEVRGLIGWTGKHAGRTRQIKVYRLAVDIVPEAGPFPVSPAPVAADAVEHPLTVPEPEQSRNRNSPETGVEQSRKRDTEPFLEPLPLSQPNGCSAPTPAKPRKTVDPKGFRLPEDWREPSIDELPAEIALAVHGWPPGKLENTTAAFRDYYRSVPAAKGRKTDWTATYRNWLRKEIEHGPPRCRNTNQRTGGGFAALITEDRAVGF